MSPEQPAPWKPPFCGADANELTCPACGETECVRVREHEEYFESNDYEAYCCECHAELIVYASVKVEFYNPEVRDG